MVWGSVADHLLLSVAEGLIGSLLCFHQIAAGGVACSPFDTPVIEWISHKRIAGLPLGDWLSIATRNSKTLVGWLCV